MGQTNYDDQACDFMAEGILRTAHNAYEEKAKKIMQLAREMPCENCDQFEHFSNIVDKFYPQIDEQFRLEKKVFEDLYQAMSEVFKTADRRGDEMLKRETASYLNDLAEILNDRVSPDVELAEEVANWLETNLATATWNVSGKPHITVNGDHPKMAELARKSYSPAADFGADDYGDVAPVSDGKNVTGAHAQEMRHRSWGQEGGNNIFPSLSNPYVPDSGTWTMKADTGVDKDWGKGHGSWGSEDTWPNLQNPYVPSSMVPKMNHGKEQDLVVDV
jgi:hypothetical protein